MKVLIIDDEAIVRLALKRAFEMRGHQVYQAENGHNGKEIWLNEGPDLVYLDILMPGQNGLQVLEDIGKLNKSSKSVVVLMSAYSGVHDEAEMKNLGARHFLKKPFENVFQVVEAGESLVHERNQD